MSVLPDRIRVSENYYPSYKTYNRPVLIATWSKAIWAVWFYEKNGFKQLSREKGNQLQRKYWSSPEIKINASVVLADEKWFEFINRKCKQ